MSGGVADAPFADAPCSEAPVVDSPWRWAVFVALGLWLGVAAAVAPLACHLASVGLFLLGVSHGAVERVTDAGGRSRRRRPTARYTVAYLIVGAGVFAVWQVAPVAALAVFLGLSALHFGLAEPRLRLAGLWVVTGSLLFHTEATLDVFKALVYLPLSEWAGPARGLGAGVGAAMLVEGIARGRLPYALLLIGAFWALPPVPAVALYFFAVHALDEWMAAHGEAGSLRAQARLYLPFALPATLAGGVAVLAVLSGWVSLPVAAGLGIAAVVPHMIPLDAWLALKRARPRRMLQTRKSVPPAGAPAH